MAALVFSGMNGLSTIGSLPLGAVHAEIRWSHGRYDGYFVERVDHFKEKTVVGHEFHALRLRLRNNPSRTIVVRIERRPSTRNVASSQSSEFWTDDSITQLDSEFDRDNYYHISTTTCNTDKPLTILALCEICAFIRNASPIYSVMKAKHCYWFCAAFLVRLRALGYSARGTERRKHFQRRGRFQGIRLVREVSVEKELSARIAAVGQPQPRPSSFLSLLNFFVTTPQHDGHTWILDRELIARANWVTSVCFTPDGRHLLSSLSDKTICIWDTSTGKEARRPLMGHTQLVFSIVVSSDGHRVVAASVDAAVRIWDMKAGVPVTEPLQGRTDEVRSIALSPDGSMVVSGSDDGSVRSWDVATGAAAGEHMLGHEYRVWSVAWSPDGRYVVSGSMDLHIWDVQTGLPVGQPLHGHIMVVNSVAFSPDGRYLVSGSSDTTARVWDIASGQALHEPLHGHTHTVYSVAFSPDGRWIASGSADETMCIWDYEAGGAGGPVARLSVGSSVRSVGCSPDGDQIAAGCDDGKIHLFRRVTN